MSREDFGSSAALPLSSEPRGQRNDSENFTPGPWAYEGVAALDDGPASYRIYALSDTSYEATLCELWSGEHDNEACARLITAAPELYAELTSMLNRYVELVNCGDCGSWDPETEDEVKRARAVLAKAIGTSQS